MPPWTFSDWPVMLRASSEAKNATALNDLGRVVAVKERLDVAPHVGPEQARADRIHIDIGGAKVTCHAWVRLIAAAFEAL